MLIIVCFCALYFVLLFLCYCVLLYNNNNGISIINKKIIIIDGMFGTEADFFRRLAERLSIK